MHFNTANEYRRHLAAIIDDPKVIDYAVERKFPAPKPIGVRKFDARGRTKPSETDGDYFCQTDRSYAKSMALSNERFLAALNSEIIMIVRRRNRKLIG